MSRDVAETLLEMHYHSLIVESFMAIYGANFLKMYKPSQQDEAWVGFDQGWTQSNLSQQELFNQIRNSVQNASTNINNFFVGYFLQYKVVQKINRRSKYCPINYSTPYYRSEISLIKNKNTNLSQHETLMNLSAISNAQVYYICPMMFSSDDIYKKPDPNTLQIVPIYHAPSGWLSSERHFLTFQTMHDNAPFWNSEPVQTESITFSQFMDINSRYLPKKLNSSETISLIGDVTRVVNKLKDINERDLIEEKFRSALRIGEEQNFLEFYNPIPQCFTILEFEY